MTMKEENLPSSTAIRSSGMREIEFAQAHIDTNTGYMAVATCQGNHRYFVAETFAVEGEGTVGAIVICTACGESKVITHKVASVSSSILLKQK